MMSQEEFTDKCRSLLQTINIDVGEIAVITRDTSSKVDELLDMFPEVKDMIKDMQLKLAALSVSEISLDLT